MKAADNNFSNPITEGVIWKQILFYFFPLLLSSFFQQLYNTADAMIVGRAAGKEALSAVGGSAGSVLGIFMMFYIGFGGGAAVLEAQFFGARKEEALRSAVRMSLISSGALGLIGMLICFCFADPVLSIMGTPADVYLPSLYYLRIAAFGMIPSALYNMGASVLRAVGDVRHPLLILIVTCLSNIGLDLVFVAVLRLGAPGAALATILCQLLSAFLVLWCLFRTVTPSAGDEAADDASILRRVLKMGLPLGAAEIMYTFANVVLMAVVNGFGTDTVAAYAAYGRIDAIFWMIVGSFGISITTFVGQNIGAGRWDRVMQSIRDCAAMMFVALGAVLFFIYVFAARLQGLFCTDPEVVLIGTRMMRFLIPFYFLYIPIEVMYGALRGMGDSLAPTLLTFLGICVLRSAWGIFIVPFHHTVNMVLLGFPVTWIVTTIMFAVYFVYFLRKAKKGRLSV